MLLRMQPIWTDRLARGIAYLLNPLVFPPLLIGLVLAHAGAPPAEIAQMVSLVLVCFTIAPAACAWWMVRRGLVQSIEMPRRRGRTRAFAISSVCFLVALGLTFVASRTAPHLLTALIGCYALNALLVTFVTWRWKLSVHAAAGASFVSMLLFAAPDYLLHSPSLLSSSLLPVALLMWARVRSGAHTKLQVLAGALFGGLVPYAELWLLAQWNVL